MLVDDVLGAAEEVATFCAHFPVELRAQIGEGRVAEGLKEVRMVCHVGGLEPEDISEGLDE